MWRQRGWCQTGGGDIVSSDGSGRALGVMMEEKGVVCGGVILIEVVAVVKD